MGRTGLRIFVVSLGFSLVFVMSEKTAEYPYGYEVCNEVAVIVDIVIVEKWKEQGLDVHRLEFGAQLLVRWLN